MYWSNYTHFLCIHLFNCCFSSTVSSYLSSPFHCKLLNSNFCNCCFLLLQIIVPSVSDWEHSWRIAYPPSCCPCTKLQIHRGTRYWFQVPSNSITEQASTFWCILIDLLFSAECTIGMVWGWCLLKHYSNKALWQ